MKVRELAKNKNLTVDERINELMKPTSKGAWSTCTLCGVRVKAGNMVNHMRAQPWTAIDAPIGLKAELREKRFTSSAETNATS